MTDPILVFPWHRGTDPAFLRSREWLVTNGLGGYASGTLLGIATRRYHGPFVPNLPAPRGRTVMIPRLDEEMYCGTRKVQLGGAELADGTLETEGYLFLKEFRREWQTPTWVFELDGHVMEKRVIMPYGQNTVYITYTLLHGGPVRFHLRPYFTFRMHDGALGCPAEWPFTLTVTRGRYEVHPFEGAPAVKICLRPHCGVFVAEERSSRNVLYQVERNRGYDHQEDLFSPGYFTAELHLEQPLAFTASIETWESLDLEVPPIFVAEQQRLEKMLTLAPESARSGLTAQLILAADQFI
ncbi:MAG: glycogen debranching enzyme N-terminal domain-containing protein, partial [Candidatus Binatia bacterium]